MKKKILITGVNSYVGNSFAELYANDFDVTKISLRNHDWKSLNFSQYDAVLHVSAIVHNCEVANEQRYFDINTNLSIKLANKAKNDGVRQFVFLSTMAVYGEEGSLTKYILINKNTKTNPKTFYGDSKLQAEVGLKTLECSDFNVAIIGPPMVYGEGTKGN